MYGTLLIKHTLLLKDMMKHKCNEVDLQTSNIIRNVGSITHHTIPDMHEDNILLASCPWGPATAHGVGILTEMDVIYAKYGGRRSNGSTFLRRGNMDNSLGNIYGFILDHSKLINVGGVRHSKPPGILIEVLT